MCFRSAAISLGKDGEYNGPSWTCTDATKEWPPIGFDKDFEPLCLHADVPFTTIFIYHDIVTGMNKKYDDLFTLNVVGGGHTWDEISYWKEEKIAKSNSLCGASEEEKKKYKASERILFIDPEETDTPANR